MKTKCYCIYCPNHPKYGLKENAWTTFYNMYAMPRTDHGVEVNCLSPITIETDDFTGEFPVTAYSDGYARSFSTDGLDVLCMNEVMFGDESN